MPNWKKEKINIEVQVPSRAIHIQHARCPKGCDLMDPEVKINGFPAVKVAVWFQGQKGILHLDPVYGSFDNISTLEIPDGAIREFSCPHCGESLRDNDETCNVCSSPMFALNLPRGGIVEGCLKKGCREHSLKLVDSETLLSRLFENETLKSYL